MKYLLYLSLFVSNVAYSGTIYQCKNSLGKVNFQDKPCSTGEATVKETKTKDISSVSNSEHSMWVEPNFVDTQYSVLLDSIKATKVKTNNNIYRNIPFGWTPYYVNAKIIDVYKGNLNKNDDIELLIYISANYLIERINKKFILSFCKSRGGIYYTSRNYLIQKASRANIGKFKEVRKHGTDYKGSGNCTGNYPSLNPDSHN